MYPGQLYNVKPQVQTFFTSISVSSKNKKTSEEFHRIFDALQKGLKKLVILNLLLIIIHYEGWSGQADDFNLTKLDFVSDIKFLEVILMSQ